MAVCRRRKRPGVAVAKLHGGGHHPQVGALSQLGAAPQRVPANTWPAGPESACRVRTQAAATDNKLMGTSGGSQPAGGGPRTDMVQVLWIKMQADTWNWMQTLGSSQQSGPCPPRHYVVLGIATSASDAEVHSVVDYFPDNELFEEAISSDLRADMDSALDKLVGPRRMSERLVGPRSISERFVRRARS